MKRTLKGEKMNHPNCTVDPVDMPHQPTRRIMHSSQWLNHKIVADEHHKSQKEQQRKDCPVERHVKVLQYIVQKG